MKNSKELTKEEKINEEINRLNRIFKDLDKNKLDTVQSLIGNAAFTKITLDDLQVAINIKGCVEEYQNGANQKGFKKSSEVDIHIAMTKNLTTIMKQLAELCPPTPKKNSKLGELREDE